MPHRLLRSEQQPQEHASIVDERWPVTALARVDLCNENLGHPRLCVLGHHDARDIRAESTRYITNETFAAVVEGSHDGLRNEQDTRRHRIATVAQRECRDSSDASAC